MINSKRALTATTVLGIFGIGWLITPDAMAKYWRIAPGENLNYLGSRYGALLIGLAVTVWLARNLPNTQARRALMIGAFVSLALTTALSLYGALALELNAWPPFAVELALTLGLAWALFVKPEPLVRLIGSVSD
jgi:uncharacterized BrkB/YihY/UPF0761 family membrane protein